jgi:hypothetical protein
VQGNKGLPVEAHLHTETELPVKLSTAGMDPMPVELKMPEQESLPIRVEGASTGQLPVEVSNADDQAIRVEISGSDDEALAVSFGLPVLPAAAMVGLGLVGVGFFLTSVFALVAAISSRRAAKDVRKAAEKCYELCRSK